MALIPQETIDEVIARIDIVEVISSYLPLKRAGRNFKANCPFHNEKTPSFVVNPDKQIFHCFGCSVGGNAVSFVMRHEHLEFPEALRLLAQKVNVEIVDEVSPQQSQDKSLRQKIYDVNALAMNYFHQKLVNQKLMEASFAREYLKKRGISLETVKNFQLGYAKDSWEDLIEYFRSENFPLEMMKKAGLVVEREKQDGCYDRFRDRIIFPIMDVRGNVCAFGARTLQADAPAKYLNSPETPVYTKGRHLYGFNVAKQEIAKKDFAIIVEGYMDCLVPYQFGVYNIVASLGTALTVDQIRILRRYTHNVVMLFDMDEAGKSAMLRSFDTLIEEDFNVRVATLKPGHDPDSYIREFGVKAFNQRIDQSQQIFDYKYDYLSNKYDAVSVLGKAAIAKEMLTTISKYQNAVIRSSYIKKLAENLKINEEALVVEMKKIDTPLSQRNLSIKEQPQVLQTTQQPVERSLLRLIIEDNDLIPLIKNEIALDDFQEKLIRDIISKVYQLHDQGNEVDAVKLINELSDDQMKNVVSSLMLDDAIVTGEKKRIFNDCINRLKSDRLKVRRRQLMKEIKEAEFSGDDDKLNELKLEFNQLVKR